MSLWSLLKSNIRFVIVYQYWSMINNTNKNNYTIIIINSVDNENTQTYFSKYLMIKHYIFIRIFFRYSHLLVYTYTMSYIHIILSDNYIEYIIHIHIHIFFLNYIICKYLRIYIKSSINIIKSTILIKIKNIYFFSYSINKNIFLDIRRSQKVGTNYWH